MTKKQIGIVWALLIILSTLLYWNNINKSPRGRHYTGMENYFAITLRFIDSNFDFFHPKTYCLNPQYSGENGYWSYAPKNPKGITAIDFPIHEYIVAVIMKICNSQNYIIYRLYMLFLSLLGLYYLALASKILSKSYLFSLFLITVVFLSPTFSFFANSYLVSSAALSFLFIAFYTFVKFHNNQSRKKYLFIIFLTLAALTRFPFIIFLIAYFFNEILENYFSKKRKLQNIFISLSSLLIVLGYFTYNKIYLSHHFGSIFLSSPNTNTEFLEFIKSLLRILTHKSWYYGTVIHYILLFIILKMSFKKIKLYKKSLFIDSKIRFLIIASLGIIIYSFLMIKQFAYHDYYILDTYFPIIVFWSILSFSIITKTDIKKYKPYVIPILILMLIFNKATSKFDSYYRGDRPQELSRIQFENAYKTLDSLHIDKNAKLLVLNATGSNSPLLSFRRKGYSIVHDTYQKTSLENIWKWDYDYIITESNSLPINLVKAYPNLENETSIFFSNEKFTIHSKN